MCHLLLGTALLASGAAALNQLLEREYDAKMRRTQDRPLPSGRLQPQTVLMVGCASAIARADLSRAGGQSHDEPGGRAVAGLLPVCLYAAQARDVAEHAGRRSARRAAAVDGVDCGARGIEQRRAGPVRHSGLLATAALHGHRLDLPRRIRPRRFQDAAGRRPARPPHGPPGRRLHAGPAAGERVPVPVPFGRPHLPGRARWSSGWRLSGLPSSSPATGQSRAPGNCFMRRSCICRCCWR